MATDKTDFREALKQLLSSVRKNIDVLEDQKRNAKDRIGLYKDAANYAEEIGKVISDQLIDWIKSGDISGDAVTALTLARDIIPPSLKEGYDFICAESARLQELLNKQAGLDLAAQIEVFDKDAAENLAKKVVDVAQNEGAERATWVVDEPVKTFCRQVQDRNVEKNIRFQARAGLQPTIERVVISDCCKWCRSLAGRYRYGTEPDGFYRRHERCRCLIIYDPADGRAVQINAKWRG